MICRELGIPTPIALQPYYHALNRQPEVELLPAAAHFGLGVVPFSPLARGILTGKYRPGEEPDTVFPRWCRRARPRVVGAAPLQSAAAFRLSAAASADAGRGRSNRNRRVLRWSR